MKLTRRRPMTHWLGRLWHWLRTKPCFRCGAVTPKKHLHAHSSVDLFGFERVCGKCWQALNKEDEDWRYERQVAKEMERLRAIEDARLRLEAEKGAYRGPLP